MDAGEADFPARVGDVFLVIPGVVVIGEGHRSAETERQIKLRDLVVLGHVRIEVVLPVPLGDLRCLAFEEEAGEDGLLDGGFVEDRQGTGQAETGGAYVGVGFLPEAGPASAEHLAAGVDLAVNLKTDGGNVILVHQGQW